VALGRAPRVTGDTERQQGRNPASQLFIKMSQRIMQQKVEGIKIGDKEITGAGWRCL
jgi:hypothetical protein